MVILNEDSGLGSVKYQVLWSLQPEKCQALWLAISKEQNSLDLKTIAAFVFNGSSFFKFAYISVAKA